MGKHLWLMGQFQLFRVGNSGNSNSCHHDLHMGLLQFTPSETGLDDCWEIAVGVKSSGMCADKLQLL